MIFNKNLTHNEKIDFNLNQVNIEHIGEKMNTKSFKFLGYHIDEKLSFKHHIEHLKSKASIGLFQLNRLKYTLNKHTKLLIYFAFIHSHLTFGIALWKRAQKTLIKQLQILQNKSIRAILKLKYNESTSLPMKNLGIPNLQEMGTLNTYKIGHQLYYNNAPKSLCNLVKKESTDTRNYNSLNLKVNKKIIMSYLTREVPEKWNSLPNNIKEIKKMKKFHQIIKKKIL